MKKTRRGKRRPAHQQGVNDIPTAAQIKTDWPDREDRKEDQRLDDDERREGAWIK